MFSPIGRKISFGPQAVVIIEAKFCSVNFCLKKQASTVRQKESLKITAASDKTNNRKRR